MEITSAIKSDFLTFDTEQVLSEVIGKLRQYEQRHGLVFKKDKYLGILERKRLLRSRFDASRAKIDGYIHHTPIINEHADIIEAAYTMYLSDADFLPVESNKKIIGVLTALDLAALAAELPETKSYRVKDAKLVKVDPLHKDDPISTAIKVMYKKRVDQVSVFEAGKLYGVVSFRDILKRYLAWAPNKEVSAKFSKDLGGSKGGEGEKSNLALLPVSSFSTTENMVTIDGKAKLRDAVETMMKKNVSSVIVMEGSDVAGLLTLKNILRLIGSLQIPQNFNIRFVGLNDAGLDPYQKNNIKKITSNEAFKLQRAINNEFSLVIHIKDYTKSQRERKYSVTLRLEFPSQLITATQYDWRVETALRKTFDNAKNAVKKRFRGDSSWRKYYQ